MVQLIRDVAHRSQEECGDNGGCTHNYALLKTGVKNKVTLNQRPQYPFELVAIRNAGHTNGGAHGDHKWFDFFVRYLRGIEPPPWSALPWVAAEDRGGVEPSAAPRQAVRRD